MHLIVAGTGPSDKVVLNLIIHYYACRFTTGMMNKPPCWESIVVNCDLDSGTWLLPAMLFTSFSAPAQLKDRSSDFGGMLF